MPKWIPVYTYAKLKDKSSQWIYMKIRLGKIKSRKVKKEVERIEVLLED